MAHLGYVFAHEVGRGIYVDGLNQTTTYSSIYISCNGYTSGNLARSTISDTSFVWYPPGLQCGQRYTVSWNITSKGGSKAQGDGSFSSPNCSFPVGSIPFLSPTIPAGNFRSLVLSWGTASNATSYYVSITRGWTSVYEEANNTSQTVYLYSLPDGDYSVTVFGRRFGESDGPSRSGSFTIRDPNPVPGGIGAITLTPSSDSPGILYVSWGGASGATSYTITVRTAGGSYVNATTSSTTYTNFSGLTEGAGYYVIITPTNSNGSGPSSTSSTVYMPVINVRPSNWAWYSAKNSGGAANVTAAEWNDFCNRIRAFQTYRRLSPLSTFTSANRGWSMNASQINEARAAIARMNSSVPSIVYSGNTAFASHLNSLRNSLNAIT